MRIFIQHGEENYSVYRINRTPSKITGMSGPSQMMKSAIILPDCKEVHFTYPEDGDFHYTYEFSDGSKIREFHDRIVNVSTGIIEKRTEDNFINILLAFHKQQELHASNLFFQFPATGIPINDGSAWLQPSNKSSTRPVPGNDIVIPSHKYSEVSISVILLGEKQKADPKKNWANINHILIDTVEDSSSYPRILLLASGKSKP